MSLQSSGPPQGKSWWDNRGIPALADVTGPPPGGRVMSASEVLHDLREGVALIKPLARVAGVDRVSVFVAMQTGYVSPALAAKLSWVLVGLRDGRFHFATIPGLGQMVHLCEGPPIATLRPEPWVRFRARKRCRGRSGASTGSAKKSTTPAAKSRAVRRAGRKKRAGSRGRYRLPK